MWVEFKIYMDLNNGTGSMECNLEKGADPSKIDMNEIRSQLLNLFDRMTPAIKDVKLNEISETFSN